jgi:hypothetical protein
MTDVTFTQIQDPSGNVIELAVINHGNNEFTFMPKADYDALQANSTLPSNSSIPQAGE